MNYEWTKNYVSTHASDWMVWTKGMAERPVNAVEVGSFEGRSAIWWLDNVIVHEASRLTLIDPCPDACRYARLLRNLSLHERLSQCRLLRNHSRRELPALFEKSFDLAYIDGSHEGMDVMLDALLVLPKLKPGGTLIFDDYDWKDTTGQRKVLPKPALDMFLQLAGHLIEVVSIGYQVCVRRKSESFNAESPRNSALSAVNTP